MFLVVNFIAREILMHTEGSGKEEGNPREQDVEYMGDSPIDHKLSFSLKVPLLPHPCTSLIRNTPPVGPYSSPMPRDLW